MEEGFVRDLGSVALAVVIGWEAFVVLFDVRGLSVDQAREIITSAATTLVDAALAPVGTDSDSSLSAGSSGNSKRSPGS